MKEKDIIRRYQKQVAESKETAPFDLWPEISQKLDVEEIWDNVSANLDKDKRKKLIWIYASWAAVFFGVAFLGSLFFVELSNKTRQERELASEQPVDISPQIEDVDTIGDSVNMPKSAVSDDSMQTRLSEEPSFALQAAIESTKNDHEIFSANGMDKRSQELIVQPFTETTLMLAMHDGFEPEYIDFIQLEPIPVSFPAINTDFSPIGSFDKPEGGLLALSGAQGLSFGLTTAIKNTWLFNQETFDGFNVNVPGETNLKFFPDLGVNIRYHFSPQWAFETSAFFSSKTGQSYNQFIYGRFTQKEIALNYMQIELHASRKSKRTFNNNSKVIQPRTSVGIYLAKLNSASETIAGEREKVIYRYNGNDYGFILGQDFDINLGNNLSLSPGLMLKWGLQNVYSGEANIPASLKATFNRSIEFRLSVDYNLNRK
jgi:hypothetical protein